MDPQRREWFDRLFEEAVMMPREQQPDFLAERCPDPALREELRSLLAFATERPVLPCESRYRKRSLVSAAVAKPAYWRIVQNRERYMVACTPLVKGYSPGRPRLVSGSQPPSDASV